MAARTRKLREPTRESLQRAGYLVQCIHHMVHSKTVPFAAICRCITACIVVHLVRLVVRLIVRLSCQVLVLHIKTSFMVVRDIGLMHLITCLVHLIACCITLLACCLTVRL